MYLPIQWMRSNLNQVTQLGIAEAELQLRPLVSRATFLPIIALHISLYNVGLSFSFAKSRHG